MGGGSSREKDGRLKCGKQRLMRKCASEDTEAWMGRDGKGWGEKQLGENGKERDGKKETQKERSDRKGENIKKEQEK